MALRLVCEREQLVEAHVPQIYWTINAALRLPSGEHVQVRWLMSAALAALRCEACTLGGWSVGAGGAVQR